MRSPDDPDRLRAELQSMPPAERLDYLAGLPEPRLVAFKRILSKDDIVKLNRRIDVLVRKRREPTLASWLADARAGRAATPDAMIEVLKEAADRLRPQDAEWIKRIETTAGAGGYSKRQQAVIEGIYRRYFVDRGAG